MEFPLLELCVKIDRRVEDNYNTMPQYTKKNKEFFLQLDRTVAGMFRGEKTDDIVKRYFPFYFSKRKDLFLETMEGELTDVLYNVQKKGLMNFMKKIDTLTKQEVS